MAIELRLLSSADLAELESWFEDASTTRWLGDSAYPVRLVDLAAAPGRWAFVAVDEDQLLALIDVECDATNASSAAVALVVAPSKRRQGIGASSFAALAARPELSQLRELVGEVETGNVAAEQLVLAAGFHRQETASDSAFSRYVLRLR